MNNNRTASRVLVVDDEESQRTALAGMIGLWGYSGGGLASAWAAEMSGSYAPELNIVGAVLGSPVGDLGHTFRRLNGTYMSGLPAPSSPRLPTSIPNSTASSRRTPPKKARRCCGGCTR